MADFVPAASTEYMEGFAGIAVARTAFGQHVGLVYHVGDGPRIVHLAFHHDLRDEAIADFHCYLTAPIDLEPAERIALAGLLANAKDSAGLVPYGFDWEAGEDCFDDSGQVIPFPLGKGLTCATFVDAILRHAGYQVANRPTWNADPEDAKWQADIIKVLKHVRADPEHIELVSADIGLCRLRPEQISGCAAASASLWPVEHEAAKTLAAEVMDSLTDQLTVGAIALL